MESSLKLIFALMLVAIIASCARDNAKPPAEQGIRGQYALSGPGTQIDCSKLPPEQISECEQANLPWTRPFEDAAVQIRDTQDRIVTTVRTDALGNYQALLPMGEYLVCSGGCEGPVTVEEGKFTDYPLLVTVP